MKEKTIEQHLVHIVKKAGGLCPKFVSPGMDGMPDRLVLLPEGRIAFIEVKAPGKKPRPLQLHRHEQLRKLGFHVFVLDDPKDIPSLIRQLTLTGAEGARGRSESPRQTENLTSKESTCEGGLGGDRKAPQVKT